jgi:hypothetical protein
VVSAGRLEERELLDRYAELCEADRACESRATGSVLRVVVIADALRIVEHREQDDDDRVAILRPRGKVEADRRHMTPVLLAVEHRPERRR